MATATKKPPAPRAAAKKPEAPKCKEFPINLGSMSGDSATCGISVRIDRRNISLDTCEELFCARRLEVRMFLADDNPNQKMLWENARIKMSGVVDVRRFSVSKDKVGLRMVMVSHDVSFDELREFTKKDARLQVFGVMDPDEAPEGDDDDDDEDADEEGAEE